MRHKSINIATSVEWAVAIGVFYYEADLPSIFPESLAKINPGTLVETSKTLDHVTHANEQQDLRGYWIKVHKIFTKCRGIIGATIHIAILPFVVECQCTEWRRGVSVFADTRHKSVTISTSVEPAVAVGIFCYEADLLRYIFESLAKIYPSNLVETMQKCVFVHVCIHPLPANWPQHFNDLWH